MINFFLGVCWLVFGVAILGYEFATGNKLTTLRWFGLSPAWLMLVLAAYNFTRLSFHVRASRRAARSRDVVRRPTRVRRVNPDEPINPDFVFTDDPPPKRAAPPGPPPSVN